MQFTEFLRRAKLSGYAANGEGDEIISDDGGKKFTFIEHDLEYQDIYYGFNPFIGQETVRQQGKVVWIMNYSGKTSLERDEAVQMYYFLRMVLRNSSAEMPLRGPSDFEESNYQYTNKYEGDIDSFYGNEIILINGQEIYWLQYHGGSIME
jgi:hypothetical protein